MLGQKWPFSNAPPEVEYAGLCLGLSATSFVSTDEIVYSYYRPMLKTFKSLDAALLVQVREACTNRRSTPFMARGSK